MSPQDDRLPQLLDRIIELPANGQAPAPTAGDLVLYRTSQGRLAPACLIELAGGGCWLARDARHTRGLFYLDPGSITARLPPSDLIVEAA